MHKLLINCRSAWVIIASIFLLSPTLFSSAMAKHKYTTPEELLAIPAQERLLIDVRTVEEFEDGHIPSAVNLPLGDLPETFAQLKNKDQQIILYCRSGRRVHKAISFLESQGYTNLQHLEGDFIAWSKQDRTVVKL